MRLLFGCDPRIVALLGLVLLAGCATRGPAPSSYGARAAEVAKEMVGVRYRYGGASPKGFDCSGLAYYAYRRVGMSIPRTSSAQKRAATAIDLAHASAGDLLFFDTRWNRRHVAIYLGDRRFVSRRRRVRAYRSALSTTAIFCSA